MAIVTMSQPEDQNIASLELSYKIHQIVNSFIINSQHAMESGIIGQYFTVLHLLILISSLYLVEVALIYVALKLH